MSFISILGRLGQLMTQLPLLLEVALRNAGTQRFRGVSFLAPVVEDPQSSRRAPLQDGDLRHVEHVLRPPVARGSFGKVLQRNSNAGTKPTPQTGCKPDGSLKHQTRT